MNTHLTRKRKQRQSFFQIKGGDINILRQARPLRLLCFSITQLHIEPIRPFAYHHRQSCLWVFTQTLVTASKALEEGQRELAQAKSTAEKILAEAKQRAQLIREDGEKRTVEEMARIKQDANANLNAEAARVIEALRAETARTAIDKALAALPKRLNDAKRAELIDRSIEALG